ncbi:MAG: ComEC/Rec2 family competence protein [Patescibacteria group bacterium]
MQNITLSPSWIVFLACIGIGAGISFASWLSIVPIVTVATASFGILFWVTRSIPKRDRALLVSVFAIGVLLGAGRYWSVGPGVNSIANDVGHHAVVEGLIVGSDLGDDGVTYTLTDLVVDDSHRDDRLLVRAPISAVIIIGDRINTSCVIESPQPFDGFAYDRFLAAKSVYAICSPSAAPFIIDDDRVNTVRVQWWKMIGAIHEFVDHRVRSILPEPQATLLLGLLMGENSFSETWKIMFRETGTSHIVAASGYNVAVVADLALILLVTLGLYRRQAYPIAILMIGGFVIIAGAGAAVIRAGVMGVLALTSRHIGRHTSPRNIIALTIAAMLLVEPRLLRDDVGFQLSIAATIGLIVLTDRIAPILKRVPTSFGVRESLASTLAATISTLPITLVSFGSLSVVAPFVNMLVLPFIPFAMAFGAGSILVSSIVPQIGVWIALPAWTALASMTGIIGAFARIPFASVPIPPSIAVIISMIGLATVASIIRKLHPAFERDLDSWHWEHIRFMIGAFVLLFIINIGIIGIRGERWNTKGVHVWVFDVGQGDGIYLDGADRDIVIDGGPTRFGMLEKLATVRFPWERHLDVVIATHPHADHIIGLIGLIGSYSVDEILNNGMTYSAPSAEAFTDISPPYEGARRAEAGEESVVGGGREIAHQGISWSLGPDSILQILWPPDATTDIVADNVHARSIVALLTVGEKKMLFTGDAEAEIEAQLGNIGHVDILKVGHHGSDTSSGLDFLEILKPEYAIISVGADNHYGHPTPFTIGRLESVGGQIFRTDLVGDILIDINPKNIIVY